MLEIVQSSSLNSCKGVYEAICDTYGTVMVVESNKKVHQFITHTFKYAKCGECHNDFSLRMVTHVGPKGAITCDEVDFTLDTVKGIFKDNSVILVIPEDLEIRLKD